MPPKSSQDLPTLQAASLPHFLAIQLMEIRPDINLSANEAGLVALGPWDGILDPYWNMKMAETNLELSFVPLNYSTLRKKLAEVRATI